MFYKLGLTVIATIFFAGCSSVPLEPTDISNQAKKYDAPNEGMAGLYIYRDSMLGAALKKDLWVNDNCIGETAPKVFFYTEVEGGKKHKVSTESEFSPNDLFIETEAGKHYFVEQYIKMGVMVGGANVELVTAEEGKKAIKPLKLAVQGKCSK